MLTSRLADPSLSYLGWRKTAMASFEVRTLGDFDEINGYVDHIITTPEFRRVHVQHTFIQHTHTQTFNPYF